MVSEQGRDMDCSDKEQATWLGRVCQHGFEKLGKNLIGTDYDTLLASWGGAFLLRMLCHSYVMWFGIWGYTQERYLDSRPV
jgi:hypothetical protein